MAKLSDSQLSASKKKKKKKERVLGERLLNASSPQSSNHSFIFSGHAKETLKKKKKHKEALASPLDNTSVSMESEITSKTGVLVHKKKKKKKKMRRLLSVSSPQLFDHSSVFSGHDDDKVGEALSEKEEQNKVLEPQLDNTLVSMESEITSETGVLVHKKKKKKRIPVKNEDVRVSQENLPETDLPENLGGSEHVVERTPIKKKKRAKASIPEPAEVSSPNTSKWGYIEPIGAEDTLEDLFASTPLSPTLSSSLLSQRKEKGVTDLDTTVEMGSPRVEKKSRKKRKEAHTKDSDNVDCLATEEDVNSTDHDSQQTRSSPKQGTLKGNNR